MPFRLCLDGGLLSAVFCILFFPASCMITPAPDGSQTVLLNRPAKVQRANSVFGADFLKAVNEISGKDILKFIAALASDSLEGRGAGSNGFNKAAALAAGHFARCRLQQLQHSYFQNFNVEAAALRARIFGGDLTGDSAATKNIIGLREGSDAILKNEFVVVTAHLDHLGKKQDSVYYGANDNASGVSIVLQLSEFFAEEKWRPKRSVVFILFSGEETGLRGSKYFVEHPLIDLNKIKFQINLDLVGSGKEGIMLQGTDHFPVEEAVIKNVNRDYFHFELSTRPNSPNSDQYFFNAAGVPAFFIYAYNGTIPYHSPGDTADKIDTVVLENVAKFVLMNMWKFANESP